MRVYTYIFIITGLMMLLYLAGITTTSGYILRYFDPFNNPENFQSSTFYLAILAIFGVGAIGSYVLGYAFNVKPESLIVGSMAGLLLLFVGDIISIISYYKSTYPDMMWMSYIITLILFPVAVAYSVAMISWWRGAST